MKQDALVFSSHFEHAEPAYTILTEHGISTTVVNNERDALSALFFHVPAFLWIDLDTDAARSFLEAIMGRYLHPSPYIILTSSFIDSADRAVMLDHGADTCVEIPVDLSEILAILNAVLRREERLRFWRAANLLPCIEYKELFIDPLRRKVKMGEQSINLAPKEFDILHLLADSPGVVFTKEQIYSHIWKMEKVQGAAGVTDHISSLRQKLGLHPRDNEYIQTIFKVGYRFAESE